MTSTMAGNFPLVTWTCVVLQKIKTRVLLEREDGNLTQKQQKKIINIGKILRGRLRMVSLGDCLGII